MAPDPNALLRSEPCPQCGARMLWTQNVWAHGDNRSAAYRCPNGHMLDPSTTRECPTCGVHDTRIAELSDEAQTTTHVCNACGARFGAQPAQDI